MNRNAHKVKYHPSLQKGGCHEVHDIEDLVKVGQTVKGSVCIFNLYIMNYQICLHFSPQFLPLRISNCPGCSYYAARSMADDAQLVFCPYSYVINPIIRGAMEIDIKGAIIVFDEAQYVA